MLKKIAIIGLISVTACFAEITPEELQEKRDELKEAKVRLEKAQSELDAAKKSVAAAKKIVREESDDVEYTTKSEFSYSNTKGNTNTERFALDFHAERKHKKNKLILDITALTSSSNGDEDNNKWQVLAQYDRELTKKTYFNYLAAYGEDKFSGFDYQFNTGPGLGYKLVDAEKHKLDVQSNILYSKDKLEDGTINEYASLLAGFKYKWNILDNFAFLQNAYYKGEVDEVDNYFIFSKSAIETKINDTFALGMSYKVDYKNEPANGKKRTDKTFLASFIINY